MKREITHALDQVHHAHRGNISSKPNALYHDL